MTGSQRGATALEYALLVALCAVALIAALNGIQDGLEIVFEQQREHLENPD